MKKLLAISLLGFFGFIGAAQADDMRLPFVSVTDGDTIRSSVRLPCPLCNVYIRIRGIDTPESNHNAMCEKERDSGIAAKRYLNSMFDGKTHFMARDMSWDKFGGRIVANVELDGRDVGRHLIEKGYAKPYNGNGPKPNWC